VTFDPFGDFESRGYLRNFASLKDISQVKDLEYASFQGNLSRAINALADIDFIEYKHVLAIHTALPAVMRYDFLFSTFSVTNFQTLDCTP
jgi:cell filamentation protein